MIDPEVRIGGNLMAQLTRAEVLRYSRHLMMPEVGMRGQEKLKAASVLIVGAGGLGSPIAMYLAAAGVGRIGLVDFDVVELSNLQRQIIHGDSRIGELKVTSAGERLKDINPYISIEEFPFYVSADNIMEIGANYDIIVDGSDNFATRYLLNDYCVFEKKPYIYGSIYRFEGQVAVFNAQEGPCYRCIFPEPPPPGMIPTCGEGGVFGVLPGTIGTIQATEVIKIILGIGTESSGNLFLYDALDLSLQKIQLRKNINCMICGEKPTINTLEDTAVFCGLHEEKLGSTSKEKQIYPKELKELLESKVDIKLIDVRDPAELAIVQIPGSENIPYEKIIANQVTFNPQDEMVFICRNGVRSQRIVNKLLAEGFEKVFNLKGGTNAWVEKIDPRQYQY